MLRDCVVPAVQLASAKKIGKIHLIDIHGGGVHRQYQRQIDLRLVHGQRHACREAELPQLGRAGIQQAIGSL